LHQFVPKAGNLRPDESDEARSSFGAEQYRRGKGTLSRKELLQFLFHARGSLLELQTQITIGCELGFLPPEDGKKLRELASEVGRLLNGLVNRFQVLVEPGPQVSGARSSGLGTGLAG
jgi:hypothetical protein